MNATAGGSQRASLALSTINFRDLGGIEIAGGRRIGGGRFYRGEGPASFAEEHRRELLDLGIRLICDLRSEFERTRHPHLWGHAARILQIDIAADLRSDEAVGWEALKLDPTPTAACEAMRINYRSMPAAIHPHLAAIVEAVLQNETPMLIHCTAGKDRTGVLVALLLAAWGADRRSIDADYMRSLGAVSPGRDESVGEQFQAVLGFAPEQAVLDAILRVDTSFLDAAFEAVIRGWGSVDAYFREAGVSDDAMQAMRRRVAE